MGEREMVNSARTSCERSNPLLTYLVTSVCGHSSLSREFTVIILNKSCLSHLITQYKYICA